MYIYTHFHPVINVIQGWIDGVTIGVAVVIIVFVTATNNYLKEQQYSNLYKQLDDVPVMVTQLTN